jgi:hypothetical protein
MGYHDTIVRRRLLSCAWGASSLLRHALKETASLATITTDHRTTPSSPFGKWDQGDLIFRDDGE